MIKFVFESGDFLDRGKI